MRCYVSHQVVGRRAVKGGIRLEKRATQAERAVKYETVAVLKLALALLAAALLLVRAWRPVAARTRRGVLAALAAAALATFLHFGHFHSRYLDYGWLNARAFLHTWDLYHYYTGAKYFDELGYDGLYAATLVADAADGGRLAGVTRVRNLAGEGFLTRGQVMDRTREFRDRFSPERWRAFTADVRFFTTELPPGAMASILVDHGYNPTPAWNTTGSFLANRVPVQRLLALALIDVALLLAAAAAIRASFGVEAALAAAAFFGVNAFAAFSITGGSFLRYDWLLGLVAALCLIRRGRYAGAGFFLAYAALVRVFPALFLFGLACKALAETARDRRLPSRFVRLFLSFAVSAVLLLGYGSLNRRGLDGWREFAGKIAAHHRTLSANSIGFTMVFLYDQTWGDRYSFTSAYGSTAEDPDTVVNRVKGAEADRRRGVFLLCGLAVLALSGLAVLGRPDHEAMAWGAAPIFMLLNLSDYYYAFLVVGAAVWYGRSRRRPLPLLLLTLLQALVLWIGLDEPFAVRATALASLAFLMYLLTLLASELILQRKHLARRFASLHPGHR
jgi:hypothetical protein